MSLQVKKKHRMIKAFVLIGVIRGYLPASLLLISLVAAACSTQRQLSAPIRQAEKDFHDHIGFVLYDPATDKTLCDYQGERYFTPASNTKIFTFYTSLQLLKDSVPALRYVERNDSLIFWGTGDPGFLYKNRVDSTNVFRFLKDHPSKLYFSSTNFQTQHQGPGWGWDDYMFSFQVEKTPFPIYGNRAHVRKVVETIKTTPPVFSYLMSPTTLAKDRSEIERGLGSNDLTFSRGKLDRPKEWDVPFHYSDALLSKILKDTLKRDIELLSMTMPKDAKTLYSTLPDSLYKEMMIGSDNFIAEQLLMMCAQVVSDTLKPEIGIKYAKENFLKDLPDVPIWIDGSGLSRYNLFTPRSMVKLWGKIAAIVPQERLFQLIPVGGKTGTIKNYFKSETPYIFAKTGTLSNNYALSGFLVTKRGRTLIFSWMNNNFTSPVGQVRARMETVLKAIYEKY